MDTMISVSQRDNPFNFMAQNRRFRRSTLIKIESLSIEDRQNCPKSVRKCGRLDKTTLAVEVEARDLTRKGVGSRCNWQFTSQVTRTKLSQLTYK